MAKDKKAVPVNRTFDWGDGQSEILNEFLLTLVAKTNPDYTMVGKALAEAYLAMPEGTQDVE